MKRIVSVVLAAGGALLLSAATAQAQVSIGVGGGLSIPTGTLKDGVKTGWNALANVGYDLPSGIGVRGDFYYAQHKFKGGVDAKFKFAGGLGNILYNFKSAGTIHPYILGSVGFMNAKTDVSGAPSETKIAFGGGAGLKFKAGTDASIFAEGRYITVNTSGDNANFIPITVGVSFGLK
ncbi:MAG TPA: outer membrane beta-barrel protein [Gemmatimonadales bacterium]|nr:outer membrane beta-barrel protein [Gemmatimonadales bacterium]